MNTLVYIFILGILNAFLIYFVHDFYDMYFQRSKKYHQYKFVYIIGYLVLIGISMSNFIFIYDFILYFCVLCSISMLYKSTYRNRAFISFLCLIFIEGIEILSKILLAAVYDTTVSEITTSEFTTLIVYSVARFIPFALIKIVGFMKKESSTGHKNYDIPKTLKWFIFILIPIFSMIGISILSFLEDSLNKVETIMMVSVIGIFLIINILYLYIYDVIVDRYHKKNENIILNKQIEYYNNQYVQVENNINEIRQIKHDLKFKLINILQNQDIEMAKKEISALIDETNMMDYVSYTSYHGIDSILNYEVNRAKLQNIEINVKTTVYKDVNIDSKFLCVILGNAIDNAIEANENITNKYIDITILSENNGLYISVKNPYIGTITPKELKENYTSKQNSANHGFGLKSIRDIANKLGGTVKINTDNNIFTLEILIFDFEKCLL